jgi:hypothetical protein
MLARKTVQQSMLVKQLRCGLPLFYFVVVLAWLASAQAANAQPREDYKRKVPTKDRTGFALMEFFTSENCKHCAEAEETLTAVQEDVRAEGQMVYLMSFHVDYLNTPTWKDGLSRLGFSERQYYYASLLRQNRAEAGQVVVNGQFTAPANDFDKVKRVVFRTLSSALPVSINLDHRFLPESKALHIEFTVAGLKRIRRDFFYFHVALLENDIKHFVGAGPNAGVTLTHNRAVRVLESSRFDGKTGQGSIELVLPEAFEKSRASVICFVQDPQNGKVMAALQLEGPFKLQSN